MSAYAGGPQLVLLAFADAVVRTVSLIPPANGKVIVNSSGHVRADISATQATIRCSITQGTTIDSSALQYAKIFSSTGFGASEVIAGTRGYDVVQGVPFTVNLVCDRVTGEVALVADTWLSAVFAPN